MYPDRISEGKVFVIESFVGDVNNKMVNLFVW